MTSQMRKDTHKEATKHSSETLTFDGTRVVTGGALVRLDARVEPLMPPQV